MEQLGQRPGGSLSSSVWLEQRVCKYAIERMLRGEAGEVGGPSLTSRPGWHSGAALPHPHSATWHSCPCDTKAPHQQNSSFLPPRPAPPSVRQRAMGGGWHLHRCQSGGKMATSGVSEQVPLAVAEPRQPQAGLHPGAEAGLP